jgi:hypothetical protein
MRRSSNPSVVVALRSAPGRPPRLMDVLAANALAHTLSPIYAPGVTSCGRPSSTRACASCTAISAQQHGDDVYLPENANDPLPAGTLHANAGAALTDGQDNAVAGTLSADASGVNGRVAGTYSATPPGPTTTGSPRRG